MLIFFIKHLIIQNGILVNVLYSITIKYFSNELQGPGTLFHCRSKLNQFIEIGHIEYVKFCINNWTIYWCILLLPRKPWIIFCDYWALPTLALPKLYSCCFISTLYINDINVTWKTLMVWWVVRSILHGVDPLSYFSFQPVLHDWCNKGQPVRLV